VRGHDIELADILDAIRKEASELGASHEPLRAAERDEAAAPAGPLLQVAASPNGQASATPANGAAAIVRPSQVSRIPTVASSLYVKTDAAERARRLEEERRRQRNGGEAPADDEATVSFVVRVSRQG
jgi:hypothetical protein